MTSLKDSIEHLQNLLANIKTEGEPKHDSHNSVISRIHDLKSALRDSKERHQNIKDLQLDLDKQQHRFDTLQDQFLKVGVGSSFYKRRNMSATFVILSICLFILFCYIYSQITSLNIVYH